MAKKSKEKPIKESVFSTRNKAVILYSKLFGSEKTNEIFDKTFSNNNVVSRILDAENHGFEIFYWKNDTGLTLLKQIIKPGIDVAKCKEKYWNTIRVNLLKLYDEETADAITEHYNPLILEVGSSMQCNSFDGIIREDEEDKPDAEVLGLFIQFHPELVKEYSKIEKKVGNKIIKYVISWEDIASVFIDSHIQVFGYSRGIPFTSAESLTYSYILFP